ncbi:MAG: death-on-curing protein [Prosthecobacter sp.]|nr:death-on-curing protein [Prosthecobacter sp.]
MNDLVLHPALDTVLAIHAELVATHGGSPALRSRELLESALAAPQAMPMADPLEIAAAYLFFLCHNDVFIDDSKSVALTTCLVFLSENGLLESEDLDEDAWEKLTLGTAAGVLSRDEVTQQLRSLVS